MAYDKNELNIIGDPGRFQLLSKTTCENQGWIESTKAMNTGTGCIVQVTTQQKNEDGSYSIATALTFVPRVMVENDINNCKKITSR